GLPVLGICRGLQLVNVALGGTLWQDLPTEHPTAIPHDRADLRHARTHEVEVVAGSLAAQALGTTRLGVNSFHHQAIRALAPGLRATAFAPDGVIEAVELDGDGWVLAVQWHPEEMVEDAAAPDRGLFAALADAARAAYCR
ncbi:MAG TPA: gamma-glutamyl-gamma-aminobutyrate hydrolase family protein, partial [Gemmatimonadales bacterium]|nr:gamma-glutamyl-gamma-aminobutyrate hydrolase family protein [Gemmatimonadales bacterium]